MVISLSSWKFPDWFGRKAAVPKKRKLEEDEEAMEVEDARIDLGESVKKLKRNPPCKQCLAGIPGHLSHVQ